MTYSETKHPERVTDVRHRLLELHHALVQSERLHFERTHGRTSAGAFLERLVADPTLAWLQPMTTMIVQLDELLEEESGLASWQKTVTELRALLSVDAESGPFQRRYRELLHESPDVALAHAALLRALRG